MNRIAVFCAVIVAFAATGAAAKDKIVWPNGAKAAIALTYDDSLDSHLDIAIPALDKYGFKGTFFLIVDRDPFFARADEWRAAAAEGHELGSHSLTHPCRGSLPDRDWVKPETDLDHYTVPRMVRELKITNGVLHLIDGETVRTYAYPCGEAAAGGESYIDAIKPLFLAARGVAGVGPGAPFDPYAVPTYGPVGASGEDLTAYAEETLRNGTLGVYTFHGVGGDYLTVSADAHEDLLKWLADHKDEVWVDTFRNIMAYVKAQEAQN